LAVSVSLDSFTKLKEAMDKMVADLKKEQEEEVKFKAHCDKEFDTTEKETYAKTEKKEDLESTIAKLEKLQGTLAEEIAAAKSEHAAGASSAPQSASERQRAVVSQAAFASVASSSSSLMSGGRMARGGMMSRT